MYQDRFAPLHSESFNYRNVYSLRALGANVRQFNTVTRPAVESFDAKLPVQADARYSHFLRQRNFVIVPIGFSTRGCCLNV